jgi:hypothetical protein
MTSCMLILHSCLSGCDLAPTRIVKWPLPVMYGIDRPIRYPRLFQYLWILLRVGSKQYKFEDFQWITFCHPFHHFFLLARTNSARIPFSLWSYPRYCLHTRYPWRHIRQCQIWLSSLVRIIVVHCPRYRSTKNKQQELAEIDECFH